ncbi:MAG: replication initiation protein, partial [Pseudomonadota bacterium]
VDARDAARALRGARLQRVLALVDARTPVQRDAARKLFLSRLEDGLERDEFRRLGWRSGLCAEAIAAFWAELEPGAFDDLRV